MGYPLYQGMDVEASLRRSCMKKNIMARPSSNTAAATPSRANANFAWVQHLRHHLAPGGGGTAGGKADFIRVATASQNHSFCISGL